MNLDICVYNLENLFIQKAAPELPPYTPYKTEEKLQDLKRVFEDINADIYALSEVGGIESLEYFNKFYLNDEYMPALIKGNSDRGIEIGFLIKKGMELRYAQYTYRNHPLSFNYPHELNWKEEDENYKLPTYYMSRDLSELQIFAADDTKKEHPLAIIFNVHLKSQRDPDGIDPRSKKRRQAELEFTLKNYYKAKEAHPNIPIIICGDFNGNASEFDTDEEFKKIYTHYHVTDVLSIADLPRDRRPTFFLFNGQSKLPIQLDYAFIDEKKKHLVEDVVIYRYKNKNDSVKHLPRTKYDVWNNPSDHYPVVFTLEI
jgi:endonuclease/exonuclease/phosphatase family metal-dependent hydrolase